METREQLAKRLIAEMVAENPPEVAPDPLEQEVADRERDEWEGLADAPY